MYGVHRHRHGGPGHTDQQATQRRPGGLRYPAGRLQAAVGRHPPVRGDQRLEMRSARRAEGDGASGLHHAHHAQLAEREDAETCRSRHGLASG